jgi:hypothetical protein
MKPRIILTGDSHLGALRRGLETLSDSSLKERCIFWPLGFGSAVLEPVHLLDENAQELQTIGEQWTNRTFSPRTIGAFGEDTFVVVSLPFQSPRFLRNHDWKKHAPWHLAKAGQVPISDGMLLEMVAHENRHALAMTRDLHLIWPRTIVLESPRPLPDHPILRSTALEVVLHIDIVYRTHARNALSEWGIHVIGQPNSTIGPKGLTLSKFDHEDPKDQHHVSAEYGGLALQEVLRYVDTSTA